MRLFLFGLLVGCVASTLFALQQSSKSQETIWLGTDLTLGMAEDTVIKKLAESGYSSSKITPSDKFRAKGVTSMWLVQAGKQEEGVVYFAMGRLDSVAKYLMPSGGDEVEFGNQLYFVMRDLEQEGSSRCTIETEAADVPDFSEKTAKLTCGRKSVQIELQKFQKQDEIVSLHETLDAVSKDRKGD